MRLSKGHHEWAAAMIMLPVVLGLFVLLRLLSPGWSVPVAALVAAVVGVAVVRGLKVLTDLLRARSHYGDL
jgi:hypothetical protein